jgi:hypothetical protein
MKLKLFFLLAILATFCLSLTSHAARMQDSERHSSCAVTFSSATSGCVTDLRDMPMKHFSLQAYSSFDAATTYTALLEGSLDGSSYTTILSRTNAIPDLTTATTTATPYRFVRLRTSALASNKTVSARFQAIQ